MTGFDFTNTWDVLTATSNDARSYPFLQNNTQTPAPGRVETLYAGGDGSASNPYQIADWTHLNNTRQNLGANFTLVAELNESTAGYDSVASASANGGAGFDPVGGLQAADRFTGSFDGNNHSIDGLTVDRPGQDRVGLFGYVWNGGTVRNLTLTNATVTGDNRVGGIAGFVKGGTVRQSSVDGNVTGTSSVGGLVGVVFNIKGSITQDPVRSVVSESSATGTVTGQNGRAGGLLGLSKSTLEHSYATAQVTAGSDTPTGGLVAINGNEGVIRDSYAAGSVAGAVTGGVTGQTSGTLEDVYWDLNATGQANATALGSAGNATRVTTAELTGSDAGRNTGLAFGTTWRVVLDDYPALLSKVGGPPPLVGETPPQDLDGDGRYEDVRGDGDVNVLDVQALFDTLVTDRLQRNAVLFDFQGDDPTEVGILDVQSLYDRELVS
jgi:hypothetical protein